MKFKIFNMKLFSCRNEEIITGGDTPKRPLRSTRSTRSRTAQSAPKRSTRNSRASARLQSQTQSDDDDVFEKVPVKTASSKSVTIDLEEIIESPAVQAQTTVQQKAQAYESRLNIASSKGDNKSDKLSANQDEESVKENKKVNDKKLDNEDVSCKKDNENDSKRVLSSKKGGKVAKIECDDVVVESVSDSSEEDKGRSSRSSRRVSSRRISTKVLGSKTLRKSLHGRLSVSGPVMQALEKELEHIATKVANKDRVSVGFIF